MSNLLETHREFRAVVRQHAAESKLHWKDYREAREAAHKARDALHAVWWFVENVSEDDKSRTDIFFELREMVRDAL